MKPISEFDTSVYEKFVTDLHRDVVQELNDILTKTLDKVMKESGNNKIAEYNNRKNEFIEWINKGMEKRKLNGGDQTGVQKKRRLDEMDKEITKAEQLIRLYEQLDRLLWTIRASGEDAKHVIMKTTKLSSLGDDIVKNMIYSIIKMFNEMKYDGKFEHLEETLRHCDVEIRNIEDKNPNNSPRTPPYYL